MCLRLGGTRRSSYECHPSQVHMYARRQVAAKKGIVVAVPALASSCHSLTYCPQVKHADKCQFKLTIGHIIKYFSFISYLHIEICNGSIFCIFPMFAFWHYNLQQCIASRFSSPGIAEIG